MLVIVSGFGLLIYMIIHNERQNVLEERVRATELMAEPILQSIYEDMVTERADHARYLIDRLKTVPEVERVQVIKANGFEEAFQDLKTIEAMEKRLGWLRPEWLTDHPSKIDVTAVGTETRGFKEALKLFDEERGERGYYLETSGGKELLTYVALIQAKQECNACHGAAEPARGFLMISTSLNEPYLLFEETRNRWLLYGAAVTITIVIISISLFVSFISSGARRMKGMLAVSEEWRKGNLDVRMDVDEKDEFGILAKSFNSMADSLKADQEEIKGLYTDVNQAKIEWERTFDTMEELVVIMDSTGKILKANKAIGRRLNMHFNDIVDKNCFEVLHNLYERWHDCPIARITRTKRPHVFEIEAEHLGGTFWTTIAPLTFDSVGNVSTLIHVMTDVTALKRLTRLEGDKKLLEETDAFKNNLMSIVSHELRTHLSSIMGYIELLRSRRVDEETKGKWLEIVHKESDRLTSFMDEILDLARIKPGGVELTREGFDVVRLVEKVAEPYIHRSNSHTIGLDTPANLPLAYGNTGNIQNVIVNLLENAIKYSPEGGRVLIKLEHVDEDIMVSVADEGMGIPTGDIEKVFEPFHRADSSHEFSIKGTGLGLSISKAIIALHGGKIWAESGGEGKGTTFYFTLPLAKTDGVQKAQ
jgi:two-component system phosphate regulon sensor histidine kinase PhoR